MSDVVVTVPKAMWFDWIEEGDLPGEPPSGYTSHFWLFPFAIPRIVPGERVYIVAHGRLRGYAPLRAVESFCTMDERKACLMRDGDAEAVTIDEPIRGFQGWRYRWWDRSAERPFPTWQTEGVS